LWNIDARKKQPKLYKVVYDISPGIVATEFMSGETSDYIRLYYKFTA